MSQCIENRRGVIMGLIPCKDCGTNISESAVQCPQCGAPNATNPIPTDLQKFKDTLALEREKVELERNRVNIEQERLNLEKGPWRKWGIPLLSIAAVCIASIFTYFQVKEAREQKDNEIAVDHRRAILAQKIGLINKLALTYHQSCCALNSWHVFVLRRAREECKAPGDRNSQKIENLAQDERTARTIFYQTEKPDGGVAQIASLFEGPSVKEAAVKAQQQWQEREDLVQSTVDKREANQLCSEDISAIHKRRRDLQNEMDKHTVFLLQEMAAEIAVFRLK
jgi:hypothetical protein